LGAGAEVLEEEEEEEAAETAPLPGPSAAAVDGLGVALD